MIIGNIVLTAVFVDNETGKKVDMPYESLLPAIRKTMSEDMNVVYHSGLIDNTKLAIDSVTAILNMERVGVSRERINALIEAAAREVMNG